MNVTYLDRSKLKNLISAYVELVASTGNYDEETKRFIKYVAFDVFETPIDFYEIPQEEHFQYASADVMAGSIDRSLKETLTFFMGDEITLKVSGE